MNFKNKIKKYEIIRDIYTLFDDTTGNTVKFLGVIMALWLYILRFLIF